MKIKCLFKRRRAQIALVVREERGRGGLRCITQFLVTTYLHVFWVLKHNFHKHCLQNIYCFVVKIKVSSARVIKRRQVNIEIILITFDYSKKMYVYCLTWEFNSKLLVKGNLYGIWYFACWLKPKKLACNKKTGAFTRNWTSATEMRVSKLNHCTNVTHCQLTIARIYY